MPLLPPAPAEPPFMRTHLPESIPSPTGAAPQPTELPGPGDERTTLTGRPSDQQAADYRPEYQHGWGSKSYYTQLRLDPLGKEEAQELLTALLGEAASAQREALERLILEKTQGNPFFIEEVVQTLAEEGVLAGERGRYRLERAPGELHIPATVQGVLAARIDRLPAQEKDLLQTLAVIGKEFRFGLLREGGRGRRGGAARAAVASPGGGVHLRAAGRFPSRSTSSSTR